MRVVLVFLDGVGLGVDDSAVNPLAAADAMPRLRAITGRRFTAADFPWTGIDNAGTPIDSVLGVPGLPQSATGQVTLLTGINAAAVLGRHLNGFPNQRLREILATRSVFRLVNPATFANAFTAEYFMAVATGRRRYSATTLAALAGGVRLRFLEELLAGQAVFQDITRAGLRERGYNVPLVQPEEAGCTLARVAGDFSFTLFEYFQTDIAGHSQDMGLAQRRLNDLDRFMAALIEAVGPETLILVTSDHGNIEDLSTRRHTVNPVPLVAFGSRSADFISGLRGLDQIAPRIAAFLAVKPCGAGTD